MKTVYYEPVGRIQNSEWNLINYPPNGYRFLLGEKSFIDKLATNRFIYDHVRLQMLDRLMPLNMVKAKIDSHMKKLPSVSTIVYAYNHIVDRPIPWIVNVEWWHILIGRDPKFFTQKIRDVIEGYLLSDYCLGITTWSKAAEMSVKIGYNGVDAKVHTIPPAVPSKDFARDYDKDEPIKILFVGSVDTPEDFIAKGGNDVLTAFSLLKNKYRDIELTIRANIPANVRFGGNVRVISQILPKHELDDEFKRADIFVLPSHYAHEMVVLEAMSWGLPVVTSQIATMGEYIDDGNDGLLLNKPENIAYYIDNYVLTSETIYRHKLLKSIAQNGTYKIAVELAESIELLIKNRQLRERLGRNAKSVIDSGRHSIWHRNSLIAGILK